MASDSNIFNRPLTDEELAELLRDRAERLDPANRPVNAEVDNSEREWDYDRDDFEDNIVGGKSKFEGATAPLSPTQRPTFLRLLGVVLVLVCAFFLWLSTAFFRHSFTEYDNVTLTSSKSGLSLPERADVKLRGMIVGQVRSIKTENGKVIMTLGMDPEIIDRVPANVRAEIVPKTLFGEKYISLVPTGGGTTESLKAGDTISDAVVPIEFEKFFNDVYPLLTAVPPEEVSYTLTALANSLEGRGDALGATLAETNDYLRKLNPETAHAVDDIVSLGKVSQTYSGQMDEFGQLLENASEVNRTVVDVDDDLSDLVGETDDLATTLTSFLDAAGDDLVGTVSNSVRPLTVAADYSGVFPCLFQGLDLYLRNTMDSVLKNGTLHIDMFMISPQATKYDIATEHPIIPTQADFDDEDLANPDVHGYTADGYWKGLGTVCDELKQTVRTGQPVYTHENPRRDPAKWWEMWGIRNSHNGKLGPEADFNRPAVADVPDVARLITEPVVQGAEWRVARK